MNKEGDHLDKNMEKAALGAFCYIINATSFKKCKHYNSR